MKKEEGYVSTRSGDEVTITFANGNVIKGKYPLVKGDEIRGYNTKHGYIITKPIKRKNVSKGIIGFSAISDTVGRTTVSLGTAFKGRDIPIKCKLFKQLLKGLRYGLEEIRYLFMLVFILFPYSVGFMVVVWVLDFLRDN